MLFFELNRVVVNPVSDKTEKNYKNFQFEQRIYIDKFLEKNFDLATSIKNKITTLEYEKQQETLKYFQLDLSVK